MGMDDIGPVGLQPRREGAQGRARGEVARRRIETGIVLAHGFAVERHIDGQAGRPPVHRAQQAGIGAAHFMAVQIGGAMAVEGIERGGFEHPADTVDLPVILRRDGAGIIAVIGNRSDHDQRPAKAGGAIFADDEVDIIFRLHSRDHQIIVAGLDAETGQRAGVGIVAHRPGIGNIGRFRAIFVAIIVLHGA